MELITQILAICGAISVVGGAVAVLSGWYKSWKTYVHGSIPCIPITPTEVHLSESLPQTKRLIRDVEEDMQHEKYYSDYQGCWS